jgi:hypothetical protein
MRSNPIKLQQVQIRQQHVKNGSEELAALVEAAINTVKDPGKRYTLMEQFFSLCKSTEVAEKSLSTMVDYLNENTDERSQRALVSQFTTAIAPVIEDTHSALTELERIEDDNIRNICKEAVSDMVAIDTLINNHEKISKRFNVNGYIADHQFYNEEAECVDQICEWIDTYSIPVKDKAAIALEESLYAFSKGGMTHSRDTVVQEVMEYFLVSNRLTGKEAKRILERCQFIDKDDTKNVRYLFNEMLSDEVHDVIDQCKVDEKFNDGAFKMAINRIYANSAEQVIDGTPNILGWIRQLAAISTLGVNVFVGIAVILADKYIQMKISRKQCERVVRNFKEEKEKTTKAIEKASDDEARERLQKYSDSLDAAIDKIDMYKDTLYTSEELNKQAGIENEAAMNAPTTFYEFKVFKFQNLLHLAADASNYIQTQYNKGVDKVRGKLKKVFTSKEEDVDKSGNAKKKSPVNATAFKDTIKNITAHFTETYNGTRLFDVNLITIDISESKLDDIYELTDVICEDLENRYRGMKFYTNTSGDYCEIHMMNPVPIIFSEDAEENDGYMNESDVETLKEYANLVRLTLEYVSYSPETILTDLLESNIGFDEAHAIMELQQFSGINNSDDVWDRLVDKYYHNEMQYHTQDQIEENTLLNDLQYNFNGEEIPFDVQVEACGLMRDILNEGILNKDKPKNDKDKKKFIDFKVDVKKGQQNAKPQKKDDGKKFGVSAGVNVKKDKKENKGGGGIDFSGVKVAMQGLKSKVANLGVKEKEVSRDLDVAASGFMRSIENALTSNRREGIIKGSIIPSFSKCLKTALGAGAIAVIADPATAIIALFGAFAGSKYLNDKERMLLLDEVEVELKVVEKEIQIAESDGDMQKYRKLLTYQKKLKKESFKLRYKLSKKMGKDYITRNYDKDDD